MSSRASLNHVYRTVWNQALGCTVAVAEIASSHKGVGGSPVGVALTPGSAMLRIASLSLAVALCWGLSPHAQANPTGGVAVHGHATFDTSQPNKLLVTTQNGTGTGYSAINWKSFSIPAGSSTRIEQPDAASMSINRVVTNTPSALFGTLSSNGRVVLVNQSGIAVGTGALVDTAGFTASAVGMTEADARLGRLRFAGDQSIGETGGALSIQGNLIARGGDVVLVAPSIELARTAVVEAHGGNVMLAAGQSVEVTGRGLEGITMQVQAPADQAVNLGTLRGDAVGVFAGTLKHSGLIQANRASIDGGRVLLKASGDAVVEGAGQIQATSTNAKGGRIEVLGNRVALDGTAALDASGATGGGTVLVGGDAHGDNPLVMNAQKAFVGAAATIKADATGTGDGGKVVVWADDATQFSGSITAKGGANGGNGGWVETSGKQTLAFDGRVDTTAPRGVTGSLLLDPSDITISAGTDTIAWALTSGTFFDTVSSFAMMTPTTLQDALSTSSVSVDTTSSQLGTGDITVNSPVAWASGNTLKLKATNSITLNASLDGGGTGGVALSAGSGGITNNSVGTIYANQLEVVSGGSVYLTGSDAVVVNTLAVSASGAVTIESYSPGTGLTIGTVGGTSGISSGGYLNLTENTSGGNIIINQNVSSPDTVYISAGGSMNQALGLLDNEQIQRLYGSGVLSVASGKTVSGTTTELYSTGAIEINGTVSGSSSATVSSEGPSISTGSSGVVSAPSVMLQTDYYASGSVGTAASPFRTSGATVHVGNSNGGASGVYLSHSGNLNLGNVSVQGSAPINVYASGNLTLTSSVSSSASGDAVVLAAGGNFTDGNHGVYASNGRWLIYSTKPSLNSLTSYDSSGAVKENYDFSQYGASKGTSAAGTGNGFLYSYSPPLALTSTGNVDKVYDGTKSTGLNAGNSTVNGAESSNLMGSGADVLTLTGTAEYEDKNVGIGKTVLYSGFSISAVDTNSNPVYGYTLAGGTNGTITQRALSTYSPVVDNSWSSPLNWDAVPDGENVAAVLISAGSSPIVFDATVGSTVLKSLTSARPVVVTGGALEISDSLNTAGFTQSGGAVSGAGALKVTGPFNQTGGSLVMASIDVINPGGGIAFSNLKAPLVSLNAGGGSITQSGPIETPELTTASSGGTTLNSLGNKIGTFKATNTGSGSIELTNVGVLKILGINNANGNIIVSNTGGITTAGPVKTASGTVSIKANSPLTIGTDGVSASGDIELGATNLTSSGDMVLNGPVNSSAGAVRVSAANNMTQNSAVFGALGVSASAGGSFTLGPLATAGAAPVSYSANGRVVTAPPTSLDAPPIVPPPDTAPGPDAGNGSGSPTIPGTVDEVQQASVQTNLLTTFLEKFEVALRQQEDYLRDKDKNKGDLIVEGEICRP